MIISGNGFHQKIVDKIVQLFPPSRIGQRTGLILSDHIVRVYGALKFALLIKPVIGCISLCRIVASKMSSENTAHGASPRVGVPTNPGQFEMHPI